MGKYETAEVSVDHHGSSLLVVPLSETLSARDQNTWCMGLLPGRWKCVSLCHSWFQLGVAPCQGSRSSLSRGGI